MRQKNSKANTPCATLLPSESACWEAVVTRNRSWDGQFVYAVISTGIYCRPSCPARRPAVENVRYFATPDAAEEAGFRACFRCCPQAPAETTRDFRLVKATCRLLEESAFSGTSWTLARLGDALQVSPFHLQRTFRRVLQITPKQYSEAVRARNFRALLRTMPVGAAALEAQYSSRSRIYEAPSRLGVPPANYRRGGKGIALQFAIVPCPLGELLVAATKQGICAVHLGSCADTLERELEHEFPHAERRRDESALGPFVLAILASIHESAGLEHLPLDIRGTAFQHRVWNALREIPPGETRTYGQIAAALGQPTASRAVGRACATNPAALAIPCHRAVAASGHHLAYRWGRERKKALLELENTHHELPPKE